MGLTTILKVLSEFKIIYRTHRLHIICLLSLEQTLGQIDADVFLQNPVFIQEFILRKLLGDAFDIESIIESIQQVSLSQTCVEYVSVIVDDIPLSLRALARTAHTQFSACTT